VFYRVIMIFFGRIQKTIQVTPLGVQEVFNGEHNNYVYTEYILFMPKLGILRCIIVRAYSLKV